MTHDDAIDLVVDSLIEPLAPDRARALEAHLAECGACAAEAGDIRRLWGDMESLPVPAPGAAAAVRLGKRLAEGPPRQRWAGGRRAAAAVLLLGTGVAMGRMMPPSSETGGAGFQTGPGAYLLLIRGTEPDRRAPMQQLVEEYGGWADRLAAEGRLIAAQKLTDDPGRWVRRDVPDADIVSGFFLVRAADYDEAERLARASPHIAYGGAIEVRAIEH